MAVGVPGPKKEISAERKFWLVLSDPCGLVCVIVTYFVVFFVDYMTVRNVLIPTYFASHSCCAVQIQVGNAARGAIPVLHIYDLLVPPKVYALKPRHLATYLAQPAFGKG